MSPEARQRPDMKALCADPRPRRPTAPGSAGGWRPLVPASPSSRQGQRIERDAPVEVFRAAPSKVSESPYPNTAHAPRSSVLVIGIPGTGYFVQNGPDTFGPPINGSWAGPPGTGSAPRRGCCRATSRITLDLGPVTKVV